MTAIALDVDLEAEVAAWTTRDQAADDTIDPLADCARVWCDDSGRSAVAVGGFCECCGAHDHHDM